LDEINERCVPIPSDQSNVIITLTSTNAAAQQINLKKLEEIDHPSKIYTAKIEGLIKPSQYPLDQHLLLKQGAQIMTMRNDPGKNFVNGSLGIIEELKENSIIVRIENQDKAVEIHPVIWEIIRYTMEGTEIKTDVIGSFTQLPVKLAWAVTIHKSQGKTFEHVIIDLGKGAFENGQVYVALSRCKTLDGIYLTQKLSWKDIRTDERVTEFLQQWA
jgi:ATP-dependent exoDNAse (exonuclease V) alpha subunit